MLGVWRSGWSAGNWAHEDASDSELIASWKDLGAFLKVRGHAGCLAYGLIVLAWGQA